MTLWFEVAVVMTIFAVSNVLLGHFEERTPKWRRLVKMVVGLAICLGISVFLGRAWFWAFLGASFLGVLVIHGWWLPSKGINGWTGEPRDKYYALRGWKQ